MPIRQILYLTGIAFLVPELLHAADSTIPGELVIEPPTLISLGFEWFIEGDDNRNAEVSVACRETQRGDWFAGAPLLRIGNERINENALQYITPTMFAGSVFDLEPSTAYQCRFTLSDPDGVSGDAQKLANVTTRAEPVPDPDGNVYHVYPPDHEGPREEPAFTGLLAAYYTGVRHSDNFNTYPPRVQPGDTILVHAGLYKDNRYSYQGGLGTISSRDRFETRRSGSAGERTRRSFIQRSKASLPAWSTDSVRVRWSATAVRSRRGTAWEPWSRRDRANSR